MFSIIEKACNVQLYNCGLLGHRGGDGMGGSGGTMDPSTAHDEKKNVEMDAFILQDLTEAIK